MKELTEIFLQLFCEKNSDGTKNLRLKGKDMWQRIHKRLNDKDMPNIVTFLNDHLDIIKLDLCYNNIGDNGVRILVDGYLSNNNNTLLHLNLMSCSITANGMKSLYSIADSLHLKTLRVNGNKLGFEGGKVTAELLGKCPTLKLLDVGDTDQTLATINYFMSVLRDDIGTNSTLRILDFSRVIPISKMYQYDPAHLAETLGEMLKVNTSITELHIQKNEFDGHDIELLLIGMQKNTTLLLLDLGFNRIGDHGIELLAKWLKKRPSLLGLNVAGNGIRDIGARALSFGMPFSKVRLLDITYNHIGNDGMIDILNSIKKPYVLRLFYFWGNKFSQKTHKVIQRMLVSGVLVQDQIDIKLYTVDKVLYAAYYPMNHYKHRYYCVMDHGCPIELRIKRNAIEHEQAQPRELISFQYYDRYPEVDESLPPKTPPCFFCDKWKF